jgi:hypothetical protein
MVAANILFNTLRNHLARESNRLKFRWVLVRKRESVYLSRTHIRCRTQFKFTNRDVSVGTRGIHALWQSTGNGSVLSGDWRR